MQSHPRERVRIAHRVRMSTLLHSCTRDRARADRCSPVQVQLRVHGGVRTYATTKPTITILMIMIMIITRISSIVINHYDHYYSYSQFTLLRRRPRTPRCPCCRRPATTGCTSLVFLRAAEAMSSLRDSSTNNSNTTNYICK